MRVDTRGYMWDRKGNEGEEVGCDVCRQVITDMQMRALKVESDTTKKGNPKKGENSKGKRRMKWGW